MSNHYMPRPGGAAHAALITLNGMGGRASLHRWRRVIGWRGTHSMFSENVVEPLRRAQLVTLFDQHTALPQIQITEAGLGRLGISLTREPELPRPSVGSAYVGVDRPLNIKKLRPEHLARLGSFDYRDIPSRMGAERVAYKTGLVLDVTHVRSGQGAVSTDA